MKQLLLPPWDFLDLPWQRLSEYLLVEAWESRSFQDSEISSFLFVLPIRFPYRWAPGSERLFLMLLLPHLREYQSHWIKAWPFYFHLNRYHAHLRPRGLADLNLNPVLLNSHHCLVLRDPDFFSAFWKAWLASHWSSQIPVPRQFSTLPVPVEAFKQLGVRQHRLQGQASNWPPFVSADFLAQVSVDQTTRPLVLLDEVVSLSFLS